MPAPDWDTLAPTDGTPGNAYEFGVDVKIGDAWVNVPDITALNPQPQPKTRNRASYAAKGKARPNTYARDVNLSFNVEIVRDPVLGTYQEELQYLLDKAQMLDADNRVQLRVFDTLGADFAFEGYFNLEYSRPSTGDEDAGWFGFTAASYGGVEAIENPAEDLDPGIITALPAGKSVGDYLQIHGRNFTGMTGVTIDGIAVVAPELVDDRNIIAKVPVAAAGSAPIVVTTPEGASVARAYTVV